MVLVDTSLWIAELQTRGTLAAVVRDEKMATCPAVIQEVLQGIRLEFVYRVTRRVLLSIAILESPTNLDVFEEGARIYRAGRRLGISIRSSVDCLIAACAIRNGIAVLHSDRDYSAIARFTTLQSIYIPQSNVRRR